MGRAEQITALTEIRDRCADGRARNLAKFALAKLSHNAPDSWGDVARALKAAGRWSALHARDPYELTISAPTPAPSAVAFRATARQPLAEPARDGQLALALF